MTSWKKEIEEELVKTGDKMEDLLFHPPGLDLDREFDAGYGSTEGDPFVAWSDNWIYFCVCYDGAEWIACLPRNPTSEFSPYHFGG